MERLAIIAGILGAVLALAACEADTGTPGDGGGRHDAGLPEGSIACVEHTECPRRDCHDGMCLEGICTWPAMACLDAGPGTITAESLCADPGRFTTGSVALAVQLDDPAWSQTDCTAASCSPDAGTACCNHCTRRYLVPCAAHRIVIRPAEALDLAETGFGAYEPYVEWSSTGLPGTIRLGCLGCEAGVACSPEDPGAVEALFGRMIAPADASGEWTFEVDAIAP